METIMSDENNNEEKSFIYIEFAGIGSAEIQDYNLENVTPFQLLAMAHFLEFEGKGSLAVQKSAQIQAQMNREQQQGIIVPKSNLQ